MRYAIDVLDETRTRVAELTGLLSATLFERVNAAPRLTAETIDAEKWGYVAPGTSFLRVREITEGAEDVFRVLTATVSRERECPALTVGARGLLGDTADEVFAAAADCHHHTPAELLALVLGHSAFTPGVVEPEDTVPFVRFEYEPVFDCLLRICSLTGGELSLDGDTGGLSLLRRTGADNGAVFRYGFNLKSVSRTVDVSRLANRVYGAGGGTPLLDLTGATGGGLPYVEDAGSIARWGLRETVASDPTLEPVENVVENPILDGEYTGGLCAGWTNLGASVSRNDDPAFRLYGRFSQRVDTAAAEQGICRTVTVVPGRVYSLLAYLFVEAGTVRVRVEDGSAVYRRTEAVTGGGFVTIRIEGWKAITAGVTVKIVQEGGTASRFHVDSIQIAAGTRVKPFTVGKSADALREQALELLDAGREPEITYGVDLVDRSGDPGMARNVFRFASGDTVTVIDPVLGLRVGTRVMERELDLLRPGRVRVRLDNPSRGLHDVLAALRKAQAAGLKHTRAALVETSNAAEVGSSRLGFSSQTLRFSGSVTAGGWDSVAWSAGTLRVGYAWFTLAAGSVSALSDDSTYHFYFDRTAPAGFGHTMDSADAEGEDRICVFSVTVTGPPSPCVVHALGIITG